MHIDSKFILQLYCYEYSCVTYITVYYLFWYEILIPYIHFYLFLLFCQLIYWHVKGNNWQNEYFFVSCSMESGERTLTMNDPIKSNDVNDHINPSNRYNITYTWKRVENTQFIVAIKSVSKANDVKVLQKITSKINLTICFLGIYYIFCFVSWNCLNLLCLEKNENYQCTLELALVTIKVMQMMQLIFKEHTRGITLFYLITCVM